MVFKAWLINKLNPGASGKCIYQVGGGGLTVYELMLLTMT